MTVVEHVTSRVETVGGEVSSDGDAELIYHVLDCAGTMSARRAVEAASPPKYHGLTRGPMTITPLGARLYNVRVKYTKQDGLILVHFDCMAEKIKVHRSIKTIADVRVKYTGQEELAEAPNYKGLVGVSHDKIEGVEIYDRGSFKLKLQWKSKIENFRDDYIPLIQSLEATVNDSPVMLKHRNQTFYFEKGSLLFLGGTFSDSPDSWEINLTFDGRKTDSEITIGDLDGKLVLTSACTMTALSSQINGIGSTATLQAGMAVTGSGVPSGSRILTVLSSTSIVINGACTITGASAIAVSNPFLEPAKEGHWYVWVKTSKGKHPVTKAEVDLPDSVHIEQMYRYADFSQFEVFDTINDQEEVMAALEEEFVNSELEEAEDEDGPWQVPDVDDFEQWLQIHKPIQTKPESESPRPNIPGTEPGGVLNGIGGIL